MIIFINIRVCRRFSTDNVCYENIENFIFLISFNIYNYLYVLGWHQRLTEGLFKEGQRKRIFQLVKI